MYDKVIEIIKRYVDIDADKISGNTNIRGELGLNSLEMVNIAVAVEEEFGIEISDRDAAGIETVNDVVELIESLI